MLGNIKNTAGMLSNANKVRQQQAKLQELLSSIQIVGVSKNKKVEVTITGEQKIIDIKIDPSLVNFVYENFTSQDKEDTMMSKSIIEAVDDAISKVQGEVVKKMQETGSINDLMSMIQAAGGGTGSGS
jgi:DNA-binding protein YbaB